MTLHARDSVRSSLDDSVYASQDMAKASPKYRFPDAEWRAEDAFAVVSDELPLSLPQAAATRMRLNSTAPRLVLLRT